MRYFTRNVIALALLCMLFACLHLSMAKSESYRTRVRKHVTKMSSREVDLDNSISNENEIDHETDVVEGNAKSVVEDSSQIVNSDLMDKMSWKCANNASCLYSLINGAYQAYKRGETIKLGPFDLVKLPVPKSKNKQKSEENFEQSGRGMSSFIEFIKGNAIRVPIGPMVFSVQRADDDSNYIEVALLKKAPSIGRNQGAAKTGGSGLGGSGPGSGVGGGGLLGGGLLGGSGGGGSGIGGGGRRRKNHQDKKQFQMYIPMYLAATTFGWTMVAAKAVGLLTLKALAVSKLAFLVTASIIVKKLMDSASEKMMYQYPEHAPYMMPYNMEYPIHSMGGEMATSEMFHPSALQLAAAAPIQHQAHAGLESYGAESHLHHNIAEVQNNTNVLAALNAVGLGQKVKREDAWIAKKPLLTKKEIDNAFMSKDPLVIAAAVAAAEETAELEDDEDDDLFNTKRPLVYNYINPQNPYYRV